MFILTLPGAPKEDIFADWLRGLSVVADEAESRRDNVQRSPNCCAEPAAWITTTPPTPDYWPDTLLLSLSEHGRWNGGEAVMSAYG